MFLGFLFFATGFSANFGYLWPVPHNWPSQLCIFQFFQVFSFHFRSAEFHSHSIGGRTNIRMAGVLTRNTKISSLILMRSKWLSYRKVSHKIHCSSLSTERPLRELIFFYDVIRWTRKKLLTKILRVNLHYKWIDKCKLGKLAFSCSKMPSARELYQLRELFHVRLLGSPTESRSQARSERCFSSLHRLRTIVSRREDNRRR